MIYNKFKKILLLISVLLFFILILTLLSFNSTFKPKDNIRVIPAENEQTDFTLQTVAAPSVQTVSSSSTQTVSASSTQTVSASTITLSANRVTYQDGFYYEDITEPLKKRINGLSYKDNCTVPYEDLKYLSVKYINFNGVEEIGELICNKSIADDLLEIFYELYLSSYPIEKIRLIDSYQADDDLSCADNNTSCFNYRVVEGSKKLSKHALGLAIDINPVYNPYVTYPNGQIRIEQNRCAMAYQGCGKAVFCYLLLKGSRKYF